MDEEAYIRGQIRIARETRRLTQQELADQLQISRATVSDIERGKVQVTAKQLLDFAEALEKPVTYFFPSSIHQDLSPNEAKLLNTFRTLPDPWHSQVVRAIEAARNMYDKLTPYLKSDLPPEEQEALFSEILPPFPFAFDETEEEPSKQTEEQSPLGLSKEQYERQKRQIAKLKRRMRSFVRALRKTFLEGKRPLDVEDRPQLEEFIDAFTRFPEWLEYINLKYPPEEKGRKNG